MRETSKPSPSSAIERRTPSASFSSLTDTIVAPACSRTFASPSCAIRKSAMRCEALSESNEPEISSVVSIPARRSNPTSSRRSVSASDAVPTLDDSSDCDKLAQRLVDLRKPTTEIIEPTEHDRANAAVQSARRAGRARAQVGGERGNVLQRTVVQVVPDAKQPPLVGLMDLLLARSAPPEQQVALEHRSKHCRALDEKDQDACPVLGPRARNDGPDSTLPARRQRRGSARGRLHSPVCDRRRSFLRQHRGTGGSPRERPRLRSAHAARELLDPERDVADRREAEEQVQVDLGGDPRRQREDARVRDRAEIERVGRGVL